LNDLEKAIQFERRAKAIQAVVGEIGERIAD
jgi:hypothetical protein